MVGRDPLSRFGSTKWQDQLWIDGGHEIWCTGVVIGYQVDEFTHTWSIEPSVVQSYLYPGFTGKGSSLTHFPLEPGSGDYSCLHQVVEDFEQDLDSILTDVIKTPELDASFEETDGVFHLPHQGSCPWLVPCLICLNCSLFLAFKSHHKLLCRLEYYFCLYLQQATCMHLSWSDIFSSHQAAFGFQSSSSPDNITLNCPNRKMDQSLSDFQTGIGATTHTTLDMGSLFLVPEQLLSIPLPLSRVLMGSYTSAGSSWITNVLEQIVFCTSVKVYIDLVISYSAPSL